MLRLTEFLLARIAEDEAVAREASEQGRDGKVARWRDDQRGEGRSVVWGGAGQAVVSHAHHSQGAHIARHDPARVLAECEAKRRIVEELHVPAEYAAPTGGGRLFRLTLRLLALPYADHPDYRSEWAP